MTIIELTKILTSEVPSEQIKENEKEIFSMIPELEKCKGFFQNNDWHPYDVYEHTLHVVDNIENDKELRLAALFHDIGKPDVYKEDEFGIGHFFEHWDISKEIFEEFAVRNNINKKEEKLISKLIFFHDINLGKIDSERLEKILKNFTKEELIKLYKLKKADLLAQNKKYHFLLEEYDKQEEVYKFLLERIN